MRGDGYFDERVAARYDETYDYQAVPDVIEPVLDLLAELAGEGRALELGVGTLAIRALASGWWHGRSWRRPGWWRLAPGELGTVARHRPRRRECGGLHEAGSGSDSAP